MAVVVETIGTTGRDFSTITLWEAALSSKNTTDDIIGECYNDSTFDEDVTLNDNTPNSVTLSVAVGERHDGTAGTGARIMATTGRVLQPDCQPGQHLKLIVEWLEIDQNGNSEASIEANGSDSGDIPILRNMLIHDQSGGNARLGFIYSNVRDVLVMNNICYNNTRSSSLVSGIRVDADRPGGGCFNNTVFNVENTSATGNSRAINVSSDDPDGKIKNNLSVQTSVSGTGTAACFAFVGSANVDSDYNLSDDLTADDGGGANNITNSTVTAIDFVSTVFGSEDLHIMSESSSAHGVGVDLVTTPAGIEIDINGVDRDADGGAWDIGAHQFVSVGGGPINETLTLSTGFNAGVAPQAVFSGGVTFAMSAAQSDSPNAIFNTAQILAVNTALSWVGQLATAQVVGLGAGASATIGATADVNPFLGFAYGVASPVSVSASMEVLLSLSSGIASTWVSTLAGIVETLTLAAGASATVNGSAAFNAIQSLTISIAAIQSAQLTAEPLATLSTSVLVSVIDSLNALVESIILGAGVSAGVEAQGALSASLALSLNATISAQANATMSGLISLGVEATIAQATAMSVVESMTLQIIASLTSANDLNPAVLGNILKLVAQRLTTPTLTGSTFSTPSKINETLQ